MKIEIWSDIICPFCTIGKRHLELALEQFEHAEDADIIWRSFELDPNAPDEVEGNVAEGVAQKYGISLEQSIESQKDVARRAQAVGLTFNWENARLGNTFNAHRLIHLAAQHGLEDAAQEVFTTAYFSRGKSLGNDAVLTELAQEIGLDENQVQEVLHSDAYADAVRADETRAQQLGIHGVPFFLIEEKWAINGAQPPEIILGALRQVWAELHPQQTPQFIAVDGTGNAPTCGPAGC